MLFFTFLMLQAKPAPVPELRRWAIDTLKYLSVWQSQGAAGLPASWRPQRNYVPEVFTHLVAGCNRKWTDDGLDQIAKGFRMWEGKGRHYTLDAGRLKRYKASGKEPKGPKRWLSFEALFFTATLVKNDNDRTRLRALLNIDEPMQQLPTAEERAAAAEVRATTAEAERDAALLDAATQKALKETALTTQRQTAKRLREHSDTQKETVRAAKAAAKEQVKEAKAAAKEALKEALQERGAALEEAAAAQLEERELELQAEHGYLL